MNTRSDTSLTFYQRLKALVVGSVEEWFNHRATSKSAALAYYTLFSLAPLLIIVLAIAGAVFGEEAARGAIFEELNGLVGTAGAEAIQLLLAGANNPKAGAIATIIATVLLLIGATTAFSELKYSLDEIWDVPIVEQSGIMHLIRTRLLSFSIVLVLAFLLLVSLSINAAIAVLQKYWSGLWDDVSFLFTLVSSIIPYAVIASLFAAIYKLLPEVKLPWRDVLIGALGTAGLFMLGKNLIGTYIGNSAVGSSYGATGSLIALLLWVYYSALIFFMGAEFTRQYALWFGSLQHTHSNEQNTSAKQAI